MIWTRSAEDNELEELPATTLAEARALRVLRLPRNHLRAPPAALVHLTRLQALYVLYNILLAFTCGFASLVQQD